MFISVTHAIHVFQMTGMNKIIIVPEYLSLYRIEAASVLSLSSVETLVFRNYHKFFHFAPEFTSLM